MSFALKKHEPIPEGVRRIIDERIEAVLKQVDKRPRVLSDKAVHGSRKHLKQIRGALRLIRRELGAKQFRLENYAYRDAGRPLSELRDAKVLIDTLDDLIKHFAGEVSPAPLRKLRNRLQARHRDVRRKVLQQERAPQKVAADLKAARRRLASWQFQHEDWKALSGGLKRVYSQAQKALRQARRACSDESLHECRKRTKDLRYEVELLSKAWPPILEPLAQQVRDLTDLLGLDHDLGVLRQIVDDEDDDVLPEPTRELLIGLIRQRRKSLQKDALNLAAKLLEESAREFTDRLKGYWNAWHQKPAATQAKLTS